MRRMEERMESPFGSMGGGVDRRISLAPRSPITEFAPAPFAMRPQFHNEHGRNIPGEAPTIPQEFSRVAAVFNGSDAELTSMYDRYITAVRTPLHRMGELAVPGVFEPRQIVENAVRNPKDPSYTQDTDLPFEPSLAMRVIPGVPIPDPHNSLNLAGPDTHANLETLRELNKLPRDIVLTPIGTSPSPSVIDPDLEEAHVVIASPSKNGSETYIYIAIRKDMDPTDLFRRISRAAQGHLPITNAFA